MDFITSYFPPIMLAVLVLSVLLGFSVSSALAACGLLFAVLGIELGLFETSMLSNSLPMRMVGLLRNDILIGLIPATLMAVVVALSKLGEEALDTLAQLFGGLRGSSAYAVLLMFWVHPTDPLTGPFLLGLVALPLLLRSGYDPRLAAGLIVTLCATHPSLWALAAPHLFLASSDLTLLRIPLVMVIGATCIAACSVFKPEWVPALPKTERLCEANGASGWRSLALLALVSLGSAALFAQLTPEDLFESLVGSSLVGLTVAFVLALLNRLFKLNLLSRLAERVAFRLVPLLGLFAGLLSAIFFGLATPAAGMPIGAVGALLLAVVRKRMSLIFMSEALRLTLRLAGWLMAFWFGSTVFSLTFQYAAGPHWLEQFGPWEAGAFVLLLQLLTYFTAQGSFRLLIQRMNTDPRVASLAQGQGLRASMPFILISVVITGGLFIGLSWMDGAAATDVPLDSDKAFEQMSEENDAPLDMLRE